MYNFLKDRLSVARGSYYLEFLGVLNSTFMLDLFTGHILNLPEIFRLSFHKVIIGVLFNWKPAMDVEHELIIGTLF